MATAERFSIFTASLTYGSAQTLNLVQLESFSVKPQANKSSLIPGGLVDRAAVLVSHGTPQIGFTIRDLATLFGQVSLATGLATTGTSTFRMQERSDGSTFETGATHETWTTTGGFVIVDSLTANQDDANGAMATCTFVALWNGTTDPLVHNTGVNFSGVAAPAFGSQFFLGPVYHNSAALTGITSVTVNPGLSYEAKAFSGDPYPRRGVIVRREPTLSFTAAKIDTAGALDMFGGNITNSIYFYFQRGVDAGERVAAASSVHCSVGCTSAHWSPDEVSVSGNDDGTVTVTIMPKVAISVSVASTIP